MEKHQFRKFSSIEEIIIDGTTGKNRKNSIEIKTFKNRIYQSIINLIIYILMIIGFVCVIFIISQYIVLKNKLKNIYEEYIEMNERIEELKTEKQLLNIMLREEIRIQKKLYKELEKIQETLKK